ncbi:MAG TPA: heme peroxidase family protein [Nannocystis sp.]
MEDVRLQGPEDARMFQDALYPGRSADSKTASCTDADDYGPMFKDLPPFADPNDPKVLAKIRELGAPGGLMDARDPVVTIVNPLDANPKFNPDNSNPEMTVGFTFLGQFLDHDITFDPSPLHMPATTGPNLRSPFLDLDSVYGRGPDEDRILYDRSSELERGVPAKFLIDFDAPNDLPRTSQQRAIIADPRNDENVIVSQLHLAMLKFHNRVVEHVVEQAKAGETAKELFTRAQQLVRWHYQYIVVNQFLRVSLDPTVYADVRERGPKLFKVSPTPTLPREFQVAAYRFGHSQIRPGYQVNVGFGAPIFDAEIDPRSGDPNDLRGGRRADRRFVEWDTFFDFGTLEVAAVQAAPGAAPTAVARPKVKRNKRIDPFISTPMFKLPVGPGLVPVGDTHPSLPGRNLERHLQHGLPSGQAIAKKLGYAALSPADLDELAPLGFHTSTPLWYYILKEALLQHKGQRLGQVGSRIIAEVFIGLLLSDKGSYLSKQPGWQPELPRRDGSQTGPFTMVDLLSFAGVA